MAELKAPNNQPDEAPPILRSWKRLYLLVLFNLIFLIVIFYLFTRIFS